MSDDSERGQSTVEFALILPLVFALMLVLAQLALVAQGRIQVTHGAREVARALAVDPGADAHAVLVAATTLDPATVDVTVVYVAASTPGREVVQVTVSAQVRSLLPSVHAFAELVTVESGAAMLVE